MILFATGMRHLTDVPPVAPTNHERYADFVLRNGALPGNTFGLCKFDSIFGGNAQADAQREMSLLPQAGGSLYKRTQGAGNPAKPEISTGPSTNPAQGRAAAPDGLPNSGNNNHSAGCGNGPAKESEA